MRAIYLDLQPGTAGAEVKALLGTILEAAKPTNPVRHRAGDRVATCAIPTKFAYDPNVLDVDCGGRGIADCFVVTRRGLLRALRHDDGRDAPPRRASRPASSRGSCRANATRRRASRRSASAQAHAWVEVFFPGYGWVDFDPTAASASRRRSTTARRSPTPTPGPSGRRRHAPAERPRPAATSRRARTGGSTTPPRTPGIGPIIVVIIPLAAVAAGARRPLVPPAPRAPGPARDRLPDGRGDGRPPGPPAPSDPDRLRVPRDAVRRGPDRPGRSCSSSAAPRSRRPTAGARSAADRLAALGEAQRRLRFALLRLLVPRRRR